MAKQTGMGDNLYVDGFDVSGDTQSLGRIAGGPAPLDLTGIDKSAFERKGGLRDGGIDWTAFWNPENAHLAVSTLPRADRVVSYFRGTALGSPAACMVAKQIGYDPTRNADGSLTAALQTQANQFGIQWGRQLTVGRETFTAAADTDGLNLGAAGAFGLQAFLHVLALDGDDVTVTLEGSSDDGAGDAYAAITGGAFTEATDVGAQRIATAANLAVEQWIRAAVTGTFTSVDLAVVVVVNETAVVF
ncbi:hypothetical protein [Jiangella alkaliphila]|uniref:Uncharacterized protein n=1 Tax=Jiangella alkaliphila TaxID=419479 RepID=A0A1H2IEY0_9ACTN|nr:hypothetical protein [Jiangella alkaliphila]SDU42653.1 hypothetical protein SAMN04488563_1662 [Jiangella alkaliphila]